VVTTAGDQVFREKNRSYSLKIFFIPFSAFPSSFCSFLRPERPEIELFIAFLLKKTLTLDFYYGTS
jgi:hypothetical protein